VVRDASVEAECYTVGAGVSLEYRGIWLKSLYVDGGAWRDPSTGLRMMVDRCKRQYVRQVNLPLMSFWTWFRITYIGSEASFQARWTKCLLDD